MAGSYQFGCAILASDIAQVGTFFESICNQYGEVFTQRQIAPRLSFEWLGRRYLAPTARQRRSLRYISSDQRVTIDRLDAQLLFAISSATTSSAKAAADILGIPYPTAVRRIRQLEELRVIEGYFASVDSRLLNRQAYRILIHTGTSSRKAAGVIRSIATRDLRATYFVESLGPWEFEIGWELEDAGELSDITSLIGSALEPHSVYTQVLNELSAIKWSFFPAVEIYQASSILEKSKPKSGS